MNKNKVSCLKHSIQIKDDLNTIEKYAEPITVEDDGLSCFTSKVNIYSKDNLRSYRGALELSVIKFRIQCLKGNVDIILPKIMRIYDISTEFIAEENGYKYEFEIRDPLANEMKFEEFVLPNYECEFYIENLALSSFLIPKLTSKKFKRVELDIRSVGEELQEFIQSIHTDEIVIKNYDSPSYSIETALIAQYYCKSLIVLDFSIFVERLCSLDNIIVPNLEYLECFQYLHKIPNFHHLLKVFPNAYFGCTYHSYTPLSEVLTHGIDRILFYRSTFSDSNMRYILDNARNWSIKFVTYLLTCSGLLNAYNGPFLAQKLLDCNEFIDSDIHCFYGIWLNPDLFNQLFQRYIRGTLCKKLLINCNPFVTGNKVHTLSQIINESETNLKSIVLDIQHFPCSNTELNDFCQSLHSLHGFPAIELVFTLYEPNQQCLVVLLQGIYYRKFTLKQLKIRVICNVDKLSLNTLFKFFMLQEQDGFEIEVHGVLNHLYYLKDTVEFRTKRKAIDSILAIGKLSLPTEILKTVFNFLV